MKSSVIRFFYRFALYDGIKVCPLRAHSRFIKLYFEEAEVYHIVDLKLGKVFYFNGTTCADMTDDLR